LTLGCFKGPRHKRMTRHASFFLALTPARTMHFAMHRIHHLQLMKQEDLHPALFQGANKKFRNVPWAKIERQRHDKELSPKEYAQRIARALRRDRLRQQKIAKAGIEYEYPSLAAQMPSLPKKKVFA
jgi:nucleolar protein 15